MSTSCTVAVWACGIGCLLVGNLVASALDTSMPCGDCQGYTCGATLGNKKKPNAVRKVVAGRLSSAGLDRVYALCQRGAGRRLIDRAAHRSRSQFSPPKKRQALDSKII